MAIRAWRLDVGDVTGDHKEVFARWRQMRDDCAEMRNAVWRHWLVWHTAGDSPAKLREWLAAFKLAKQAKTKTPPCSVAAFPPELGRKIWAEWKDRYADIHTRTRTLLNSIVVRTLLKRKATFGALAGWMAILLDRDSVPKASPGVVPFDAKNSAIAWRETTDADGRAKKECVMRLRITLERQRKSVIDQFTLRVKGRSFALLDKILSGAWKFCGSNLCWDESKNRFYVSLCYDIPKPAVEVGDKVAYFGPGRRHPWRLRVDGRTIYLGGEALFVGARRKALLAQRLARRENYRYAASSTKGHGRQRAEQPLHVLSRAWKMFVKTTNQQLASQLQRICKDRGVGKIVYYQPTGDKRDTRLIATIGRVEGYEKTSAWDFYQVGSALNSRMHKEGLEVLVKQLVASRV